MLSDIGDRVGQAQAMENLGNADCRQGRYEQALERYAQVLDIATEIGSQGREASTLNAMGEALRGAGQPHHSATSHESALKKAQVTGDRYEQARALNGLAYARLAAGDHEAADRHWQDALDVYVQIGVPEADVVRSILRGRREDVGSSG